MQPFRLHVFVCDQQKPEGVPGCAARGSGKTLETLRREVALQGLSDEVQVTACGSLGLCERGPNLVVYPEGTWYSGVTPADVPEIVTSHFREGRPVERLVDTDAALVAAEIRGNRDRYLAAQRAREAAGALPDELVQAIRGFQESRVILTALELDVFEAVGEGAASSEVATRIGGDDRATETLLNALAAMGLLGKSAGRFACTPVTRRFFTTGSPDDARAAMLHHSSLWERWSRLTATVRTGRPAETSEMAARGDDWTRPFIAAMHRIASERAPHVVGAVGVAGVRRLLDVGGGSGAYSIAFARASPDLSAEILDLPPVLPIADGHVRAAGLEGRVTTRAGDLRTDPFGTGYDLVLVSAICHMLGPDENRDLLRRCHAALVPGGRLVISDFLLDEDRAGPKSAALFSVNMLVGTPSGASWTEGDYTAWLREAGFAESERIRLPGPASLVIARRT